MIAGDHEASNVSVRRKLKKQWKEGCNQKKSHGMENLVLALLGNPRFCFLRSLQTHQSPSLWFAPGRRWGWRGGISFQRVGFGASEVRLKREKGSTQSTPLSSCFFLGWFSFFFILKGLELFSILSGDFGNWTTPGSALFFVFFSRWLPAQSSFFPVGLGPPICSFLWAMPPAGMGATGRYEACGMLDFDCMVGWQPVLTIFQSSIGRWWSNSIFLGWCLSSFVSAYFNLWVYAVHLSFQEYSQLGP